MFKNYLSLAISVILFALSFMFVSRFNEQQPLYVMFSLGILVCVFINKAGLSTRDYKHRVYKKIIRQKEKQIKRLTTVNNHLAISCNDFFKALQEKNLKAQQNEIDLCLNNQQRQFNMDQQKQANEFNLKLTHDDINLPRDLRL